MDNAVRNVYADNAATTAVSEEVLAAMLPFYRENYGNPSSLYAIGQKAKAPLEQARATVAKCLGANPNEIYFTSCGTESDNWAIKGTARAQLKKHGKNHIVTSAFEHHAVLHTCQALEKQGFTVTYLPVHREGLVDPAELEAALTEKTALVSIMYANNEIGTIQPIPEIGEICKKHGIPFHTDAVQAIGNVPIDVKAQNIDMLSLSGHKIHAPKGIGALYVRKGLKLPPLIRGGGQEGGLRSGTEATSQIAAFAAAARLGAASFQKDAAHMAGLRACAVQRLAREVPEALVLAPEGAPHILPISLPGYKSEVVVRFLGDRGIALSSGSACHRGKPSHVFAALKLPRQQLDGALRISFSYDTAQEDVDALIDGLKAAREQLFTALS